VILLYFVECYPEARSPFFNDSYTESTAKNEITGKTALTTAEAAAVEKDREKFLTATEYPHCTICLFIEANALNLITSYSIYLIIFTSCLGTRSSVRLLGPFSRHTDYIFPQCWVSLVTFLLPLLIVSWLFTVPWGRPNFRTHLLLETPLYSADGFV
jgi:hypothetical protein